MPQIVYVVVWTASSVSASLAFLVMVVPEAPPARLLTTVTIMFFFFSAIITASPILYRLLGGKPPAPSPAGLTVKPAPTIPAIKLPPSTAKPN